MARAPSPAPRRLPAGALEGFGLATLKRLSGQDNALDVALSALLRRIDVRPVHVEMVSERRRLYGRDHPELALSALRRRLSPGEEAVMKADAPSALRVLLQGGAG